DDTGQLQARRTGERARNSLHEAGSRLRVERVHARGTDRDAHLALLRFRDRYVHQLEDVGRAVFGVLDRSHEGPPQSDSPRTNTAAGRPIPVPDRPAAGAAAAATP